MFGNDASILEAAVPILSVTDLGEALDYYEHVLGFRVEWRWGEPIGSPPKSRSGGRPRLRANIRFAPWEDFMKMRSLAARMTAGITRSTGLGGGAARQ
jgi:catechol 2,3-dioxygenase-like lactoylglutathione lyase family enzyme